MRLAFVLARYGPQVLGGAETLARAVIEQLVQRGHQVEVWTTCAQSLYTFANEHRAGVEQDNGVTVRRFTVQIGDQFDLMSEPLSRENQYRWVDSLPHSPQMYAHIAANGDSVDFLILMPYVMGTAFYGAAIHPHKSLVWPCLHDEVTAYLLPTRALLTNAAGLIFNTEAEREFMVSRLRITHPRTVVVGMGFDLLPGDADAFRQQYPQIEHPFCAYVGRLEGGKNAGLLMRYFDEYRSRHNRQLSLVLIGDGPLAARNRPGVITLGFVDEATKRNALAAAAFLCQPSLNESFAIVLMEAWAQRKPVLIHEHCPVTIAHVRKSQGGLYFANYDDFEGAVEYLLTHCSQASEMGKNGHEYVHRNYNWQAILDRLERSLSTWLEQA